MYSYIIIQDWIFYDLHESYPLTNKVLKGKEILVFIDQAKKYD